MSDTLRVPAGDSDSASGEIGDWSGERSEETVKADRVRVALREALSEVSILGLVAREVTTIYAELERAVMLAKACRVVIERRVDAREIIDAVHAEMAAMIKAGEH